MKLVNQQIIKNNNLKNIYSLIQKSPGVSRAQLAKMCNLSKTTVSSLADELIERKFIQDTGTMQEATSVGRKPNSLKLCSGQYYVIVLSWDYDHVSIKQVDICGLITGHSSQDLSENADYIDTSVRLFEKLLSAGLQKERILGICLVIPAMIDTEKHSTTRHVRPTQRKFILRWNRKILHTLTSSTESARPYSYTISCWDTQPLLTRNSAIIPLIRPENSVHAETVDAWN